MTMLAVAVVAMAGLVLMPATANANGTITGVTATASSWLDADSTPDKTLRRRLQYRHHACLAQ